MKVQQVIAGVMVFRKDQLLLLDSGGKLTSGRSRVP